MPGSAQHPTRQAAALRVSARPNFGKQNKVSLGRPAAPRRKGAPGPGKAGCCGLQPLSASQKLARSGHRVSLATALFSKPWRGPGLATRLASGPLIRESVIRGSHNRRAGPGTLCSGGGEQLPAGVCASAHSPTPGTVSGRGWGRLPTGAASSAEAPPLPTAPQRQGKAAPLPVTGTEQKLAPAPRPQQPGLGGRLPPKREAPPATTAGQERAGCPTESRAGHSWALSLVAGPTGSPQDRSDTPTPRRPFPSLPIAAGPGLTGRGQGREGCPPTAPGGRGGGASMLANRRGQPASRPCRGGGGFPAQPSTHAPDRPLWPPSPASCQSGCPDPKPSSAGTQRPGWAGGRSSASPSSPTPKGVPFVPGNRRDCRPPPLFPREAGSGQQTSQYYGRALQAGLAAGWGGAEGGGCRQAGTGVGGAAVVGFSESRKLR